MSEWVQVTPSLFSTINKNLKYKLKFPGGTGFLELKARAEGETLLFSGDLTMSVLKGIKKVVSLEMSSTWLREGEVFLFHELYERNRLKSDQKTYRLSDDRGSLEIIRQSGGGKVTSVSIDSFIPISSLFDPLSFLLLGEVIQPGPQQKFGFFVNKEFFSFQSEVIEAKGNSFSVQLEQKLGKPIPKNFLPKIHFKDSNVDEVTVSLPIGRLEIQRV